MSFLRFAKYAALYVLGLMLAVVMLFGAALVLSVECGL